jgi:hypothetical protein
VERGEARAADAAAHEGVVVGSTAINTGVLDREFSARLAPPAP